MLSPLRNRTYRRLFAAQAIALTGTGLATVALGLLAYDLAGADAGAVLGTALAIKMIAYVGVAPVIGAYADRLPRRAFLVAMDVVRAAIVLLLPFVSQVWQIYVLIFLLQSASASFTPTFQATIPDVLPEEREYTEALSLSRLAYDLESLLSPTVAAVLLAHISFHWLFAGTAVGFLASALLVLSSVIPQATPLAHRGSLYDRTTRGMRIYLATPRLRGLLSLNLAAAAGGAMVIVNTVVLVQSTLARPEADVAIALAVFGGGSMLAALLLPRILDRLPDRMVMLAGASLQIPALAGTAAFTQGEAIAWPVLLAAWFVMGLGYSAVLTPSGRLLRRSSHQHDRPALFAAQFALSHACWLLTYPLAGWLGAAAGMSLALVALGSLAALGTFAALLLWPADDPEAIEHVHADLPLDHPHVLGAFRTAEGAKHVHTFRIDDYHRHWPERG
jgi:H+ antiporter protein